jgi:hypothetical protein
MTGQSILRVSALIVGLGGTLGSCAPEEAGPPASSEMPPPVSEAMPDSARDIELVQAAESVVRFLRGELSFSELRTADTVTLRLSPEGGGTRTSLQRESLGDPANWAVPTSIGERQSLIPPPSLTQLTTKPGVHFNCLEYPLASRAPDLAALPHVGVRLTATGAASCLQTWNLTVVFEAGDGPPVLREALYDQWEW